MILLVIFLASIAFYVSLAVPLKRYLFGFPKVAGQGFTANALKSLIVGVLWGPSALISSHAAIPMPAIPALILGVIFESPQTSWDEAIYLFAGSVAVTSTVAFIYYSLRARS